MRKLVVRSAVVTSKQLSNFLDAAQSLKLYRRAELVDENSGQTQIEELYEDPLPGSHILNVMRRANTTFLIGRKGTGKSTIFQRVQHEIRKQPNSTSVYLDIKTIFESSHIDERLLERISQSEIALPTTELKRILLFKSFLAAVVQQLKEELDKRIRASLWERVKDSFTGRMAEIFEGLDGIIDDLERSDFESVLGLKNVAVGAEQTNKDSSSSERSAGVELSEKPKLTVNAKSAQKGESSRSVSQTYSDVLIRVFKPKDTIQKLKQLLEPFGVRHLFVFVDDFSELPEDAMKVVVDLVIAPFNNWSDEFIKFKIAAYPSRIYFGAVDKTKVDEVHLDIYKLYGTDDVSSMEDKAIDFTRRLVETRLLVYGGEKSETYFDTKADPWRTLFYASGGNPRTLGYLLFYLHESNLIYGKKITGSAINDAARRYFEEKIAPYFQMNKFLHESFSERSSAFSLKELLESIVNRAKSLRSHKSVLFDKIQGRAPTSHFHVVSQLESLLSTLELNFFLTKYYEMVDRDGRQVAVYALNYGLCQKYTIGFGRPNGREFRTYFIERAFDYSEILKDFVKSNQEIICSVCGERHGVEKLDALKTFDMLCPACKQGKCEVVNLSRRYEALITSVKPELLLPPNELGILQVLHAEQKPLRPAAIAEELDCSYQLVGKRGKILAERGLVDRDEDRAGNRLLAISDKAESDYFSDSEEALEVADDEDGSDLD
jgi:DNA-binding MarR family transcriptional regulator